MFFSNILAFYNYFLAFLIVFLCSCASKHNNRSFFGSLPCSQDHLTTLSKRI